MEKDKTPNEEEISTEELEQVSGGMNKAELNASKYYKDMTATTIIDAIKVTTNVIK
jgi:bacteriocin-like protein